MVHDLLSNATAHASGFVIGSSNWTSWPPPRPALVLSDQELSALT